MPSRITHHTVVVHRDGENVRLSPGKRFDFTDDEIAELAVTGPNALRPVPPASRRPAPVPEVTSQEDEPDDFVEPVKAAATAVAAGLRKAAAAVTGGRRPARNAPVETAEDDESL